jgi:hypothetical protein
MIYKRYNQIPATPTIVQVVPQKVRAPKVKKVKPVKEVKQVKEKSTHSPTDRLKIEALANLLDKTSI